MPLSISGFAPGVATDTGSFIFGMLLLGLFMAHLGNGEGALRSPSAQGFTPVFHSPCETCNLG
jgi:hypothetical protein